MGTGLPCASLSDDDLTNRLKALVKEGREHLVDVLVHLAEFDARRLHEKRAHPTLFSYCTNVLGYSEGAAGKRIHAARAGKRLPAIWDYLRSGTVHLAAVTILAPHLNEENHKELLDQARGKSKRDLELMVAGLRPRQDVADCIRRSPAPLPAFPTNGSSAVPPSEPIFVTSAAEKPPESIRPLTPERVHFGFTGSLRLLRMIERSRELLRHKFPHGKLEDLVFEAFQALLEKRDPNIQKRPRTAMRVGSSSPRSLNKRRIPQRVKREVWRRDAGRCSFTSSDGKRCPSRGWLEFDHIVPWALGGISDDPQNIRLLCRAHNQSAARELFGDKFIGSRIRLQPRERQA